jgi:hypothetical protein
VGALLLLGSTPHADAVRTSHECQEWLGVHADAEREGLRGRNRVDRTHQLTLRAVRKTALAEANLHALSVYSQLFPPNTAFS